MHTAVSAERKKLPGKRMKGNTQELRKRKSWRGSRPGSGGHAKTEAMIVKNLIPVPGVPTRSRYTGEEGPELRLTCRWG